MAPIKKCKDTIKILEVETKKDLYDFYQVSKNVYKNNNFWVQPLFKEIKDFFKKNNPFWNHAESCLFIAYKNKKPVGRIASFIDYNYCKKMKNKIGFFGFFETINDYQIAKALFKKNKDWQKSNKTKIVYGPFNGRIDYGFGFLSDVFNSKPSFMSTYNPRYYLDFAEKYGMVESKFFLEFLVDLDKKKLTNLKKNVKLFNSKEIKLRKFSRVHANKDIDIFRNLLNKTFSSHWGFVNITKNEINKRFGIKQARWILDTNLFLFLEKNGNPIGFIFSTPDYNQIIYRFKGKIGLREFFYFLLNKKKIDSGKLHIIGCIKNHRNNNFASILNYETLVHMEKLGYKNVIVGPVDSDNTASRRIIGKIGGKIYKKFIIYKFYIN